MLGVGYLLIFSDISLMDKYTDKTVDIIFFKLYLKEFTPAISRPPFL